MKIVLASRNRHKITEIHEILSKSCENIEILSLDDIGYEGEIEENGTTFEENSKIKACVPTEFGYAGMADDSGLAVDALDGGPGVYSARYAGEPCNDKNNNDKLLSVMKDIKKSERGADFVSVVSIVFPKDSEYFDFDQTKLEYSTLIEDKNGNYRGFQARGECRGHILYEPVGNGGFGYDPLFCCEAYKKTFAVLTSEEKNRISHRAMAMEKFAADLAKILNK